VRTRRPTRLSSAVQRPPPAGPRGPRGRRAGDSARRPCRHVRLFQHPTQLHVRGRP